MIPPPFPREDKSQSNERQVEGRFEVPQPDLILGYTMNCLCWLTEWHNGTPIEATFQLTLASFKLGPKIGRRARGGKSVAEFCLAVFRARKMDKRPLCHVALLC